MDEGLPLGVAWLAYAAMLVALAVRLLRRRP
jgi:hypothetical protein